MLSMQNKDMNKCSHVCLFCMSKTKLRLVVRLCISFVALTCAVKLLWKISDTLMRQLLVSLVVIWIRRGSILIRTCSNCCIYHLKPSSEV